MTVHVGRAGRVLADSVALLLGEQGWRASGVAAAEVAMATELNVEVLGQMGFEAPAAATTNDMVVAIRLADDAPQGALDAALAAVRPRP